ncbi:USH2A-like protein [Mya arenaria]|uniref:USH2A-like protein n=1 Tax=Mya arenaria TaxID=6604 RepID=A0ABY7F5Y1_MYAAR|nr:USH2A-like protein [Mya arenaria]
MQIMKTSQKIKAYIFYLLFIFHLCNGEEAIDCSGRCACCIDEEFGCGTSPGIHGDTSCLKGSVDTIYGHRCKNPCRSNCLKCTQDIGECFACKPGFYGNLTNCVDSCSIRCIDGTCENDGRCTCIQNFEGNKCDTCVQGRYGDNCEHTCSIGCIGNTCNRNGSCSCLHNFNGQNCDVCAANYEGSACESCDDGFYGKYCSKSCILVDSNCLKCKRDDEYCMKCKNGYFSSNGNCVECGINCLERKCDPTNGRCTLGCKAGFWSDICDANCNLNCSSCGQFSNGRIYITSSTNTALAALVGLFATLFMCTAAGCYLWNRRRSKPKENNSEIQLDQPETERAYEQLQRQTSEPTYRDVDANYTVLPM